MNKSQAFSFIEALFVLIIVSVLCLCCLPASSKIQEKNKIEVVKKELKNIIQYSRTMSMIMGDNLTLNPLSEENDWSKGMILFIDNQTHRYSNLDNVIQQWQWSGETVKIVWNGFRNSNYLIFSSNLHQASASGHFTLYYHDKEVSRIRVNRFGKVS